VSRRILVTIVGIAGLAIMCFGIPLALTARRTQQDDAVATLQREAARAAIEVPATASSLDPPELPVPLERGVRLAVYSTSGAKVMGAGPEQADAVTQTALQGRLDESVNAGDLVVGWPLTANEVPYGAIRAALPRDQFESRVYRGWALMVALAAVVILAAALVAWRQARRLAQPVRALTEAVDRLGAGDFSVSVAPTGVSELDHASEALRSTARRLGAVLERERQFSANASHQLRTPLTGLRLMLELGESGDGASQAAIGDALASVDRLEATIDDLLLLARDVRPDAEAAHVRDVLLEGERVWHGRLAALGRPLRVDVGEDLPAVAASAGAVRQIIEVLLANAVDHGGGVVTVSATATPGGVAIEVSDEGVGIDGDPDSVFARRQGRGTGIGLALARSLAEAEGGRLILRRARPSPCFRLVLPVVDESATS
jgi:signal transduction histidine kinase